MGTEVEGPPTIAFIERCRVGNGFLIAHGWLKANGREEEIRLVASIDGIEIATGLIERLTDRADLADLGGMAFEVLLVGPVTDPAVLDLRILTGQTLGKVEKVYGAIEPFEPLGHIEKIGLDGVGGWLFDPANLLGEPSALIIDGRWTIDFVPSLLREDLPFPGGATGARFGFLVSWNMIADADSEIVSALADQPAHTVALISSERELACRPFSYEPRIEGKFELITETVATGWAVDRNLRGMALPVDLLIDGTPFATATAYHDRIDLISKGVATAGGGFRFELPAFSPGRAAPQLEVRARASLVSLNGGGPAEFMEPRREKHHDLLAVLPVRMPAVAIIVPIHNAADDVARCLESVFLHTRGQYLLILIDDASNDPSIKELLDAEAKRPNVRVYRNDQNLGFTRTANLGIGLAGKRDVILLNSDTIVGPGWAQGLLVAAHSQAGIATVTALSNAAGAFSVPEIGFNEMPAWLSVESYARLVRQVSAALLPAAATGNGFCMYIRRDAINQIGQFDEAAFPRGYGEENDFCMRADRRGLLNIVDDRTFVYHRRSASFGDERIGLLAAGRAILDERYADYDGLIRQFENDPDFRTLRWRVRHALRKAEADYAQPRPRVLYVISTTTGGTPQTNADLMAALSDRYEPWVLRCDSRTIELFRWQPDKLEAVEHHRLAKPLSAMLHKSGEYDRVVADLILRHAFELVHIRHIAWHGLALPHIAKRLGVPVILSFHDFYTICPTIKLLDEKQQYCGGRCTAGIGGCTAELWPEGDVVNLKHHFVHRWRELMADMFAACDAFVTTSPGARQTILDNFPALDGADFRIIEHGRDFPAMEAMAGTIARAEPLRIVVPGNISAAKGAEFIEAVAAADVDGEIEFHILGDAGAIMPASNVILHGTYRRENFADHIRAIRPHVGAVFSIWPETYCHTLTELWACGLPVVAFDTGALGERLRADGGGWLFDPAIDPAVLLEELRRLKRDPANVRVQAEAVFDWQQRKGAHYGTAAMAAHYDILYRSVFERDRPFVEQSEPAAARIPVILLLGDVLPPTRNGLSRKLIYRPVAATYPWGSPEAGPGDAVLISPGSLHPSQLKVIVEECGPAGLPIIVDATRTSLKKGERAGADWSGLLTAAALVIVDDADPAGHPEVVATDARRWEAFDGAILAMLANREEAE